MGAERVFAMPDLGEGLEEGEIVVWLVKEGDEVELNQPLVEVETAKAAVEVPSPWAGRVVTLHGAAGDSVPVGEPLVTFDVTDGSPGASLGSASLASLGPDASSPTPTAPLARSDAGAAEGQPASGRPGATPVVRRLAKELEVDLASVAGSGPGGRVTADDVRATSAPAEAPAGVELIELTPARRAIATNLERQAAIPQVTTFRTLDCDALESFRSELGVSPLPVVIAGLARVCHDHPLINAGWQGDRIAVSTPVHVGLAVDTVRGLVVPVLRDAQERGIADLAGEIGRLAEGARAGTLAPDEIAGATVAVSNTGSYGSEAGTPILSPGTAVTLAVGAITPRALVVDGAVLARPACTLSCTFDHRVLDGAAAGRALTDLVALLSDPDALRRLPR